MRIFIFIFLLYCSTVFGQDVFLVEPATQNKKIFQPKNLEDFLNIAKDYHPQLKLAEFKIKNLELQFNRSKTLSDPQFVSSVGLDKQSVSISQMFPWFGKRDLAANMSKKEIDIEHNEYENDLQMIMLETRKRYYQLYLIEHLLIISSDHLDLLQHLEKVVQTKYVSDPFAYSEVIKVQVEMGKLENEIAILKANQTAVESQTKEFLIGDIQMIFPVHYHIDDMIRFDSFEMLFQKVLENSIELKNLDLADQSQELVIDMVKKDYFPDFMVGLSYERNRMGSQNFSSQNMVMGMIGMNLPVWQSSYENKVGEMINKRAQIKIMKQIKMRELYITAYTQFTELKNAEKKITLFHEILIPKAVQSLKAVESAYQVNQSNFMDLIDSQRQLLDLKKELEEAIVEKANAQAEIIKITNNSLWKKL